MSDTLTMSFDFHVTPRDKGRKALVTGNAKPKPAGRIPRAAKLMALAIRFEQLVRDGVVKNYADLARLGRVSRARLSQIQNLLLLAPDIQEATLFLKPVENGRDPVTIGQLQSIALTADWKRQRHQWRNAGRQSD